MMFCPKCGSILKPRTDKGRKTLACGCGYRAKHKSAVKIAERIAEQSEKVEVVHDEKTVLPQTEAVCPDCGNEKAYYWLVQTRAGDEPETKFLKCTKCNHTWRDYS